mgnify:CR=1 FL=1
MVLCRWLLRLPGQTDAGVSEQAVHELVTQAAGQTVYIGLNVGAIQTDQNDRFTFEPGMLAELLREIRGELIVKPALQ